MRLNRINFNVLTIVAVAASIYHLYIGFVGVTQPIGHRAIHLSFIMFLGFLSVGTKVNGSAEKWRRPLNILCATLAAAVGVYVNLNIDRIMTRFPMADVFTPLDLFFGLVLVLLVLELTRRTIGWSLVVVCLVFLSYAYFGKYMPGVLYHPGYSLPRIVEYMFFTMEGVYGMPIGVAATYVYLFILFGTFLSNSGGGEFLMDTATAIAGRASGGPAKVAIFASGFMGMISGSAVGNVVTTGTITIPLMKRAGFRSEFAGAVEAVASTGGQIMPPLMGVAAFLLAEVTLIPYPKVAISSALPAMLFYFAIFMTIHFRARKMEIRGMMDAIPRLRDTLRTRGQFVIPPIVLVYLLIRDLPLIKIALYTIISTFIVSLLRKDTRMSLELVVKTLKDGAYAAIIVSVACAAAGIVIGGISMSALGGKVISLVTSNLTHGMLLILVLTMVVCIILGMGMPAPAAYLITAVLTAPMLVSLGLPLLSAHLFCLYFAIISFITPPVAVAAYAAAGISGGDLAKTGWAALRIGTCAYIIPFAFVYKPALLLMSSWSMVIYAAVCAVIGIIFITAGIIGYFHRPINSVLARALAVTGGASLLVCPNWLGTVVGLALCAGAYGLVGTKRIGILA
jgi:TRAP transporter 4TM/12TM fusion protein